jgi:hypothetical protein
MAPAVSAGAHTNVIEHEGLVILCDAAVIFRICKQHPAARVYRGNDV